MDIHCPKCGEPWDHDELHDAPDGMDYKTASREFRKRGCEALGGVCSETTRNPGYADMAQTVYALMGEDMDGAASMMEEYRFWWSALLRTGGRF